MWNRSGVGPLGPIKPLGPGSPVGPFNPGGPSGPGLPNTTQRHMSGVKTSTLYMRFSVNCTGVPGGPGRPGGPGKNTGDVRSFSRVICRRTSALFDSRVILNQDAGNSDWGQREIYKNLKSWSTNEQHGLTGFTWSFKCCAENRVKEQTFRKAPWKGLLPWGTSVIPGDMVPECQSIRIHIRKTHVYLRVHTHTNTSQVGSDFSCWSEPYAWVQLWTWAPKSDPNVWPPPVGISTLSPYVSTSTIFRETLSSLHYIIKIIKLQVTEATEVEAINNVHHLRWDKMSQFDEMGLKCFLFFFSGCLHFVWAAGRTSWSAGNHHTWLNKCQHSSHCQTSQRDALLRKKKQIEMFLPQGVLSLCTRTKKSHF